MENISPYAIKVTAPDVYHVINWSRFGTFCNLPLNQDTKFPEVKPELPLCSECAKNGAKEFLRKMYGVEEGKFDRFVNWIIQMFKRGA